MVIVDGLVNLTGGTCRSRWGDGHPLAAYECGDSVFRALPGDTLGEIRQAVAQLAVKERKTLPANFRVAVRPMQVRQWQGEPITSHAFTDAFPELCSMGFAHLAVLAALEAADGNKQQAIDQLLANPLAAVGEGASAAEDFPLSATIAEVITMLRERFPGDWEYRGECDLGLFILSEGGSLNYGLPE